MGYTTKHHYVPSHAGNYIRIAYISWVVCIRSSNPRIMEDRQRMKHVKRFLAGLVPMGILIATYVYPPIVWLWVLVGFIWITYLFGWLILDRKN